MQIGYEEISENNRLGLHQDFFNGGEAIGSTFYGRGCGTGFGIEGEGEYVTYDYSEFKDGFGFEHYDNQ